MMELLQDAGPWQGLLTGAFIVIGYLVKQNSDKDKKLDAKILQIEQLLKDQAVELKEAAVEYAKNGEDTRAVITAFMIEAKAVIAALTAGARR